MMVELSGKGFQVKKENNKKNRKLRPTYFFSEFFNFLGMTQEKGKIIYIGMIIISLLFF